MTRADTIAMLLSMLEAVNLPADLRAALLAEIGRLAG